MNSSLHLSKFSPLRTPDVIAAKEKAKKLKKSAPSELCHEVSDAESVASVATRDIRSIARSVGDRMARKSSFSFASSDEDLFITQSFKSKPSEQPNKKPSSPARVKKPSQPVGNLDSSDSSILTDSDESDSDNETSRKKPKTVLSPLSGKSYTFKKPGKGYALKSPPAVGSGLGVNGNTKSKGMTKDKKAAGRNSVDSDEESDSDSSSDASSHIIPIVSPVKTNKQLFKHGIKDGHSKGENAGQSKMISHGIGEHSKKTGGVKEMFGNSSSSESSSEEESDDGSKVNQLKMGNSKDSGVKSDSDDSSSDEELVPKTNSRNSVNSKKAVSKKPVQDVRSKHSMSSSSEEDNVDASAKPNKGVSINRRGEKDVSEDSDSASSSSDDDEEDMDVDETDGESKKVAPKSTKPSSSLAKTTASTNSSSSDSSSDDESDQGNNAVANSAKQTHSPTKIKKEISSSSSASGSSDEESDEIAVSPSKKNARIASSSSDSSSAQARKKHVKQSSKTKSHVTQDNSSDDSSSSEDSDSAKRKRNKTLKNTSSSKKRRESFSSSDDSDDEDVRKKTKIKSPKVTVSKSKTIARKRSISSDNSSKDSDDSDDEDVRKKKKSKTIARKHSISSDNSSEDSDDSGQGKRAAAKSPRSRKTTGLGDMSSSSDEGAMEDNQPDEEEDTEKIELRFSTPKNFEVKQAEDIVAQSSLKRKQIFLISAPADFDVSILDGQSVDLSGNLNIITGAKSDKQYEVSCLPASQDHTTSLCTVASDQEQGGDALVLGPEVGGQLLVMNWIPQLPPVVLQKPRPGKHTLPDDLKPHFEPFGSKSPPRYPIEKEVSKSHKKSKAKKRHKKSLEAEEVVPMKKEKLSDEPGAGSSERKHKKDKTVVSDTATSKTSEKKKKKKHKKDRKD